MEIIIKKHQIKLIIFCPSIHYIKHSKIYDFFFIFFKKNIYFKTILFYNVYNNLFTKEVLR